MPSDVFGLGFSPWSEPAYLGVFATQLQPPRSQWACGGDVEPRVSPGKPWAEERGKELQCVILGVCCLEHVYLESR